MADAWENSPLLEAAQTGDFQKVRILIAEGADVKAETPDGRNALYFALIAGEVELAELLYDMGARLDGLSGGLHDGNGLLGLLAEWFRCGKNPYRDERRSLVDCCRHGMYEQAREKLSAATAEEKNAALAALIRCGQYRESDNAALFATLLKAGAVPNGSENCRRVLASVMLRPRPLRPSEEYAKQIGELIMK